MAACISGNVPLVENLLERGANPQLTDHLGRTALHWAMERAFREAKYAKGAFAAIFDLIAPSHIDFLSGDRLVRIDRHLSEYLLAQTLWVLFKSRFTGYRWYGVEAFNTHIILEAWQHLPSHVLKPERNKRAHLSSVLSRNEVDRDYAYNRKLFKRMRTGQYQFNPELSVRSNDGEAGTWQPVFEALNLKLVKEFANPEYWQHIDFLLASAGMEAVGKPVAARAPQQESLINARKATPF